MSKTETIAVPRLSAKEICVAGVCFAGGPLSRARHFR